MDNDELTQQLLSEFNVQELSQDQISNDENGAISNEELNNNQNRFELNQHGLIATEFIYFEGLRTGSRLVWVASEQCIYVYNTASKKFQGLSYTCFDERCKSRILIMNDGTAGKEIKTPNHFPHGPLYEVYKERCLYTWMKERCRTAPASAQIRNIYDEAVLE